MLHFDKAKGEAPVLTIDPETVELIQILRNSVRNPGSVFDRASARLSELARQNIDLLEMTALLDEHPEGYDGPCLCRRCEAEAPETRDRSDIDSSGMS